MDLRERVILITGGSGNLGSACARVFLAAGARVALTDRSTDRLKAVCDAFAASERDRIAVFPEVQLGDRAAVGALVEGIAGRFGRIDGLVNTVGMFRLGTANEENADETLALLFEVNVRTAARVCAAVLPVMLRQRAGSIVNVGSRAALRGSAGAGAYSAVKSAVLRLTESIAAEHAASGVRANCVLPDTMDTPENRKAMPNEDRSGWVTTESVAGVIGFLLSDAAQDVRGASIPVGKTGG